MNAVIPIPVPRDTDMNAWVWISMAASNPIQLGTWHLRSQSRPRNWIFPTRSIERNDVRMSESV